MFAVLRHNGIPEVLVNAINVLYNSSKSDVMVDGKYQIDAFTTHCYKSITYYM